MNGEADHKLAREISKSLLGVKVAGSGKITAHFQFPADFIGFQGHFPGNPVLPGVCKIQAVAVIFRDLYQQDIRITEIRSAKFFASAGRDEPLTYECTWDELGTNNRRVRATVTRRGERIAKLDLILALERQGTQSGDSSSQEA